MKLVSLEAFKKRAYLKIAATILTIALIGLAVVGNYGITWDEPIEADMVQWNFQYIRENKPIPENARYYGFLFNYISNLVYEIQQNVAPDINPDFIPNDRLEPSNQQWLAKMWRITRVKHYVTFIFSLIAYLSVIGLVAILAGIEHAWLGAIILALCPGFWGHSFFNPKDIPFATVFTLTTLCGTLLLNYYFRSEKVKIGFNKITLYTCLYGILTGVLTGVRIGGFFAIFYFIFAHLVVKPDFKTLKTTIIRFIPFYLLIAIFWAITTTAIQPASWGNPVGWLIGAITQMSKFNLWDNQVLFDGRNIPGKSLPWYYIPRLFSITTPVLIQIASLGGIIWIGMKLPRLTPERRACFVLVLLQLFVIPLLAILRQSTLYDGIRHFTFVFPAMAVLATTCFIWIYGAIPKKPLKIFATTLLVIYLGSIAYDMAGLHPYEYTYYNRAYGGLRAAHGQQETDYWGLSLTEGMRWLNENAPASSRIVVAGPMFGAEMVQERQKNFIMIHRDNFTRGKDPDPDYYMGISRYDYFQVFTDCPIVHSVERQETPLTIIRKCQK